MRRKLLASLLAIVMVISLLPATVLAADFSDTSGHWGEAAINRWADVGILNGKGEGNFDPNGSMTRAEFAQMLATMMGYTARVPNNFSDVPAGAWYEDAMLKLVAAGVLSGNGDGTATPNDPITREQAAVLLCRAFNLEPSRGATLNYQDSGSISSWARDAMAALAERGMMNGVGDNTAAPQLNINRASVATLADNMIAEYVTENKTITGRVDGIILVAGGASVNLDNATVSEPVIIAPKASGVSVNLTGNTTADDIVIEANSARVSVGANASASSVKAESNSASVSVAGTVNSVDVTGSNGKVTVSGSVGTVSTEAPGTSITVSGTVSNVDIGENASRASVTASAGGKIDSVTTDASNVTVSGSGTVGSVTATGGSVDVTTRGTEVTNRGASDVTASGKDVSSGSTATSTGSGSSGSGGGSDNDDDSGSGSGGSVIPGGSGSGGTDTGNTITGVSFTVTGTEKTVGAQLTASVTPVGATATYQWKRSKTTDRDGEYENLTTGSTYTLVTADETYYIKVVATGSGDYTGEQTSDPYGPIVAATAPVDPADQIDLKDVTGLTAAELTYNGQAQDPVFTGTVSGQSKTLVKDTDYNVTYSTTVKNAGSYTATLTGTGTYKGTVTVSFEVKKLKLNEAPGWGLDTKLASPWYNGKEKEPTITVKLTKDGNTIELPKEDYKVEYLVGEVDTPLVNAGDYTLRITGKGSNCEGVLPTNDQKFTIDKASLVGATVTVTDEGPFVYNGSQHTPAVSVTVPTQDNVTLTPVKDVDYEVSYNNNVNAGTATVLLTAKGESVNYEGNFTGNGQKGTFVIEKAKIKTLSIKITDSGDGKLGMGDTLTAEFTTEPAEAKAYIGQVEYLWRSGSTTLQQTTSETYEITSDTEERLGELNGQEITVTLLGLDLNFEVDSDGVTSAPVTLDSKVLADENVALASGSFVYTGSAITPEVTVTVGGQAQENGYSVAYANNIDAGQNTASVTVTITNSTVGTGSVTKKFSITEKDLTPDARDGGTVNVTEPTASYPYTGSPVVLDGLTIKYTPTAGTGTEQTLKAGTDYTLTYTKEIGGTAETTAPTDVGEYTLTIKGQGNYTGERSATFSITAKSLGTDGEKADGIEVADIAPVTYTGNAIDITPVVTYTTASGSKVTLTTTSDYSVKYYENTGTADSPNIGANAVTPLKDAGNYVAVITGTAPNYTGVVYKAFNIEKKNIEDPDVTSNIGTTYTYGEDLELDKLTVTYNGNTLEETDYDVAYYEGTNTTGTPLDDTDEIKDVGTYTVLITAQENTNYTGSKKVTFTINPADLDVTLTSDDEDFDEDDPAVTVAEGEKVEVTVEVAPVDDDADITVEAESDDEDVAKAEAAETTVTITGEKAGTATVTITVSADNYNTVTKTIAVTVTEAGESGSGPKDPPEEEEDEEPPTFEGAVVDGNELTLTYSEDLDSSSTPAVGDFTVTVGEENGGTPATVSNVQVTGKTVVLTLQNAVKQGEKMTLTYTPSSNPIKDKAGNAADAISQAVTVTNETDDAPSLDSAVVNGDTLTLTYSEDLDENSTPAVGDFTVTVDQGTATVSNVSVSGKTVVLTLSPAVEAEQEVKITYTANDKPIQDKGASNKKAGNLSAYTVQNKTGED